MVRPTMLLLQTTVCLTVLAVVTYSSISWASEVLNRTKQQGGCQADEFRCTSGECIDAVSMSDGTKDCADGSDETERAWKPLNVTDPSSPPQGGGCLLPQPPAFGGYKAAACESDNKTEVCRQASGTPVPQNARLSFKCNEGYYIVETQDETLDTICVNGKWLPQIPVCRKMCSSLASLSETVRCYTRIGDVDCSKPMCPGTRAKVECKLFYTQVQPPPYSEIICRDNGQWSDELFYCQPVCGKRNRQGVNIPLIAHGYDTKYGEFPWHVGIYMMKASNQWEQTCGGSLISPHIVLTAASCVFSEQVKEKLTPEAIKVGLGKYYRQWTRDEPYAVKADVREILIPPRYFGEATSYAQDIALIDLTDSVQVHASIMPVCIDWKNEFTITPGMLGTLAGWGKTENGIASDILLYTDLPYIDYRQCMNEVPQEFRRYITTDKFCAGFSNGTGPASGDGGGGLMFVQDDSYYIHGIVSTKVKNAKSFTTFTNVSNMELLNWLNYAKRTLDEAHTKK